MPVSLGGCCPPPHIRSFRKPKTILFSDLADFTAVSANLAPEETVKLLGVLFSQFDSLAIHHGLETIKTIGDG
jgi:class 3 adenylate cyclase